LTSKGGALTGVGGSLAGAGAGAEAGGGALAAARCSLMVTHGRSRESRTVVISARIHIITIHLEVLARTSLSITSSRITRIGGTEYGEGIASSSVWVADSTQTWLRGTSDMRAVSSGVLSSTDGRNLTNSSVQGVQSPTVTCTIHFGGVATDTYVVSHCISKAMTFAIHLIGSTTLSIRVDNIGVHTLITLSTVRTHWVSHIVVLSA